MVLFSKECRVFTLFQLGQFVSQFGSKMTSYGLILWAYQRSGSAFSTSLLFVCYLVPEVLLNFIGGSVGDRVSKKRLLLLSDALAAMLSAVVLGMLLTDTLQVPALYAVNAALGVLDAFQRPASDVTVSLLVPAKHYLRASSVISFCDSVLTVFAPAVATAVYTAVGMTAVVCMDLVTFAFAFVTLWLFIRIPEKRRTGGKLRGVWEPCVQGMKYLSGKKGILSLIGFMAFINLIAAVYESVLTPMVLMRNGGEELQLGVVSGTVGIAGLAGSLLVTKIRTKRRVPLIVHIMACSTLVCNTLLAVGRDYRIWTAGVFFGNLLIPVLMANVTTIMREQVPVEYQARVFSARNTLQYTSIPIGYLLGGACSEYLFEPFMSRPGPVQQGLSLLVGEGPGSGIAVLYLLCGLICFFGCRRFLRKKELLALDDSQELVRK